MDYAEALAKLGNRDSKKLENNTYLKRRDNGNVAVQLHATDVVTIHSNDSVTLDSGGWRTVTTKDRINSYAEIRVFSDKGIWQVARSWDGTGAVLFEDGMTIPPSGLIPGESPRDTGKAKRKVDAMVRKYIAGYVAHVTAQGEIGQPGGGDCWACYFSLNKLHETGQPNVNVLGLDHLLSHMSKDELYYVPSLLFAAAIERAPHNWQTRLSLGSFYVRSCMADDLRYYFRQRKGELAAIVEKQGR